MKRTIEASEVDARRGVHVIAGKLWWLDSSDCPHAENDESDPEYYQQWLRERRDGGY